eukprot:4849228-Pyramimonas_sp.AAC.1
MPDVPARQCPWLLGPWPTHEGRRSADASFAWGNVQGNAETAVGHPRPPAAGRLSDGPGCWDKSRTVRLLSQQPLVGWMVQALRRLKRCAFRAGRQQIHRLRRRRA